MDSYYLRRRAISVSVPRTTDHGQLYTPNMKSYCSRMLWKGFRPVLPPCLTLVQKLGFSRFLLS